MKKLKNFNKTLNYKILSALPVIGVCLASTHQTSSAMFKNGLNFFKKLEKSSSGASSYIPKPLTSSTSKIGGSSMLSGGSKLPAQTSSGLNTKTTTSTTSSDFGSKTEISPPEGPDPSSLSFQDKLGFFSSMDAKSTTSNLGARPKTATSTTPSDFGSKTEISPPEGPDPSSLSFQDKLGFFSSMGTQSSTSISEAIPKTTPSTSSKPNYSDLGARPKTHSSTSTKPSSTQTSVDSTDYKTTITNLIKEGSSKILQSLLEIHTSEGQSKTNLTSEIKNLKTSVISLSKTSYQDKFKKHYPNEDELRTNASSFGNSMANYILEEFDPKVNSFIDYIVNENDPTKIQQKIQQLSNEFSQNIGTRANNELKVRLLAFE